MLNYILGVSNPAKRKQTLTAVEKLQRDRAYMTLTSERESTKNSGNKIFTGYDMINMAMKTMEKCFAG